MGDFYVTLPSDPSPEFPDNSPSSVKVRLPQRLTLPGQGWRVALSSMSVPDTRVNLYHLVPKYDFLFYTTLMRSGVRSDVQVNMMNIDQFKWVVDGESFMKACIDFLTQMRLRDPFQGSHFVDDTGKRVYITFRWIQRGNEQDLLIDNTKIKLGGVDNTPEFWINGTLAIKMGWLTETGELGHNLSREYIDDKVPDLTTSEKYRDLLDKDGNGVFWAIEKNCLRLSMSCNWRFTNLNHAFRMVVGEPSRTLHVYCNVAQSTIVGGMKTDLLREVWYERRGRGVMYFEPKHKQFHPVRQNTYETLHVDVAETNGSLVAFPNNKSNRTLVTLHFIQDK